MKRLVFLGLIALTMFFTACEKGLFGGNVLPTQEEFLAFHPGAITIDADKLPQSAQDYLSGNFPNQTIEEAERYTLDEETYFEVELSNNMEYHFNKKGDLMAEGESNDTYIDPSELPNTIIDYITTNYNSLTIIEAEIEQDDMGNPVYEVVLSNNIELYFDANGNLLSLSMDDDDDDDDDEAESNYISLDSLPTTITNYISTNYSSYTIEEAEMDNLFGDSTQQVYEVEIVKGNQEVSLYFDITGTFIQEEIEIDSSTLPTAVNGTISSQYNNYQMEDEAEQYNRANGDIWYGVELESNSQELEVIFDSNGAVLYEIMD